MIYITHAVYAAWVAVSLALVIFAGSIIAIPGVVFWTIVLCRKPAPAFEELVIRDTMLRVYWLRG